MEDGILNIYPVTHLAENIYPPQNVELSLMALGEPKYDLRHLLTHLSKNIWPRKCVIINIYRILGTFIICLLQNLT
jgi:hypothetical protein